MRSYLGDRIFLTEVNENMSHNLPINIGVPQGSLLVALQYVLYTAKILTTNKTNMGTFTNDTVIFASYQNSITTHAMKGT